MLLIIDIAMLIIKVLKVRVPIQMHWNYSHRDANNRSIYRQTTLCIPSYISFPKVKYVFPGKGFLWRVRSDKMALGCCFLLGGGGDTLNQHKFSDSKLLLTFLTYLRPSVHNQQKYTNCVTTTKMISSQSFIKNFLTMYVRVHEIFWHILTRLFMSYIVRVPIKYLHFCNILYRLYFLRNKIK